MAAIAQLAARRSHNPKVVSSILTRRISLSAPDLCFAQGPLVVCFEPSPQLPSLPEEFHRGCVCGDKGQTRVLRRVNAAVGRTGAGLTGRTNMDLPAW